MCLPLADDRADGRRAEQHLGHHHAARSLGPRDQLLGDHAFQHERQLSEHLLLLAGRERVDDSVDGLVGGVCVERREDEVPRLRDGQRRRDRLEIPHFADQNHVRILAQHVFERRGERRGVRVHLALMDDALLVVMHVLDRILDRDDVTRASGVDQVDHGRERGGFAAPGRPGDQHEALLLRREIADDLREPELVARKNLVRDLSYGHRGHAALEKHVGAEAAQAGNAEGEIQFLGGLEALALLVREHAVRKLLRHLGRQRRMRHGGDRPVHANLGRNSCRQMEIRRPQLDHLVQQLAQRDHLFLRDAATGRLPSPSGLLRPL